MSTEQKHASKEFFLTLSDDRTFALTVENETLWVSKDVLSMFSPVFNKMFTANFKERQENSAVLPDKMVDDVAELLSCICFYPLKKEIDDDNLKILLKFSDEYDIATLRARCLKYIDGRLIDWKSSQRSPNVLNIFNIALENKLKNVATKCIPYVASESYSASRIKDLPDKIQIAVLQAKLKRVERETRLHSIHSDQYSKTEYSCERCCKTIKGRSFCRDCRKTLCESCSGNYCQSYHDSDCELFQTVSSRHCATVRCVCAYTFDKTLLDFIDTL